MTRIHSDGKNIAEYAYDQANRLIKATTHTGVVANYAYDGFGRRLRKEINGENYDYLVDITTPYNDVLEVTYKGQTESYIYGNRRIGTKKNDKLNAFYLHDEMGSLIRVTDKSGKTIGQASYDAFGNTTTCGVQSNGIDSLMSFTGYENDIDTGLMFVQARYYMSEIARFTQEDPHKGNIYNPKSLNPYMHCYNNPLIWVDKDGCQPMMENMVDDGGGGGGTRIRGIDNILSETNQNRTTPATYTFTEAHTTSTTTGWWIFSRTTETHHPAKLEISVPGHGSVEFTQVDSHLEYLRAIQSGNDRVFFTLNGQHSLNADALNRAFGFNGTESYAFICPVRAENERNLQRLREEAAERARLAEERAIARTVNEELIRAIFSTYGSVDFTFEVTHRDGEAYIHRPIGSVDEWVLLQDYVGTGEFTLDDVTWESDTEKVFHYSRSHFILRTQWATENRHYRSEPNMDPPQGIIVHSTAAANPRLRRYVGPDDGILGHNPNNNHWNVAGQPLAVHAWIGVTKFGNVATYQVLPWNVRGAHAVNANPTHIGFEICEHNRADNEENRAYFKAAYKEAVQLCAYLCNEFDFDPCNDRELIDHYGGSFIRLNPNVAGDNRMLTNRSSDVDGANGYFTLFGTNMTNFKDDVSDAM